MCSSNNGWGRVMVGRLCGLLKKASGWHGPNTRSGVECYKLILFTYTDVQHTLMQFGFKNAKNPFKLHTKFMSNIVN